MRDSEYLRSGQISAEEKAFLESYDPDRYKKPSVTADVVTLTVNASDELCILLIKRGGYPYRGKWALPGGFLSTDEESVTQAAARELFEETGVKDVSLRQLYTFSDPDRDPRMHVVSVAYTALIPKGTLKVQAGDDAWEAEIFIIGYDVDGLTFQTEGTMVREADLAFDHAKIIKMAIKRLRSRIKYEPDAFWLLKNKKEFAISELKVIYETILNEKLDLANFRKAFLRDYVDTGRVVALNKKGGGRRPAMLYNMTEELQEDMD
ncbi:MAG: NUDIX hydrolase [Lachnospiraceae bacterium]|nr:NUDIX hydrolase [Lachnospiraceae bacterium]